MTDNTKKEVTTTAIHVTVKPVPVSLDRIETMKMDMVKDIKKLAVYFAGNKEEAKRFITASYEYVRRVPKLLECDRESLNMSLLQVAYFRFMPSSVSGEAYIIPYGREAKFQLGYQGIVSLLYRTGKISAITSNIIYKNDVFEYEEGIQAKLVHKPALFGSPKGEAIGVYTIAHLSDGNKTFKVLDKEGVMAIRELSKAKDAKDSPWNSDKDPELWMWRKTCLIQHAKLLPRSQELQKAIEEDFKGEGLAKHKLDAAGPAVGQVSHKPVQLTDTKPAEDIPFPDNDGMSEEDKAEIIAQERKESKEDIIEM